MKKAEQIFILLLLSTQLFVAVKTQSLYEKLGVTQEAKEEEIINAYEQKRVSIQNEKFDANKPNARDSAFQVLRNAFETLIDMDTREIYDLLLNNDPVIYIDPKYEMFRREEIEEPHPYVQGVLAAQLKDDKPTFIPEGLLDALENYLQRYNIANKVYNSEGKTHPSISDFLNDHKNTLILMKTKPVDSVDPNNISFDGVFNPREWIGAPMKKYSKDIFLFNIKLVNGAWMVTRYPEVPNYHACILFNNDHGLNMEDGFQIKDNFRTGRSTNMVQKDNFLPNHQINLDAVLGDIDTNFFGGQVVFQVAELVVWELGYQA